MAKSRKMRKCKRITDNPDAGFTLIEVILSVAILAVVSVPILNYFTDSMRYSGMTSKQQKATYLAQEITEGLLAENKLVEETATPIVDASGNPTYEYTYEVPYFEDIDDVDADDVESKQEDNDLIYTMPMGGYAVKVTITKPDGILAGVNTLIDYGIDPLADVVYIEPTDSDGSTVDKQAVFELVEKHNQYYFNKEEEESEEDFADLDLKKVTDNPDELDSPGNSDDDPSYLTTFKKKIERTMYVELRCESSGAGTDPDEYTVQIYYVYECPLTHDSDDTDYDCTWKSSVLMNRTVDVKNLKNIYLVYHYSDNKVDDLVLRVDDTTRTNIDSQKAPRLDIIYQERDDSDIPADYRLTLTVKKVEDDGEISINPYGYTNLYTDSGINLISNNYNHLGTGSSGDAKSSALVYTIHTEIYPEGEENSGGDPLAEITTTKGE